MHIACTKTPPHGSSGSERGRFTNYVHVRLFFLCIMYLPVNREHYRENSTLSILAFHGNAAVMNSTDMLYD